MNSKILLLSNSMLFHFSFCSLYKNQFDIHPLLLRYLNKDIKSQAEHFYIQIQEQQRIQLYKKGVLTEPNRLIMPNKSIQKILELCNEGNFERIVLEVNTGTKEEINLIKKLSKTNIPISIFVSSSENDLEAIKNLEINSLFQLTDIFNLKVRF